MRTASVEVLEAFAQLEGNHHFENIINHITEALEQTMDQLVRNDELYRIHRCQGKAEVLLEILTLHDEAKDQLEQIKKRTST